MAFRIVPAHLYDHEKTAGLLEDIRLENPDHWPHGLTTNHFDKQNLWLIQKDATDSIGFVGWQERNIGQRKQGCYSVGVLPSYRNRGIAKQAVSRVLDQKCGEVDDVVALICPSNYSSRGLADSLGVQVKEAAGRGLLGNAVKRLWPEALGATGTAGLIDAAAYSDESGYDPTDWSEWDGSRLLNFGMNLGSGALATRGARRIKDSFDLDSPLQKAEQSGGLADISKGGTLAAATNLLVGSLPVATEISERAQRGENLVTGVKEDADEADGGDWKIPAALFGAGLLTTGGILWGSKILGDSAKPPEAKKEVGRMKITLPTRNPNDGETTLELPFEEGPILSKTLQGKLNRDARRRINEEVKHRTRTNNTQPINEITAVEPRKNI